MGSPSFLLSEKDYTMLFLFTYIFKFELWGYYATRPLNCLNFRNNTSYLKIGICLTGIGLTLLALNRKIVFCAIKRFCQSGNVNTGKAKKFSASKKVINPISDSSPEKIKINVEIYDQDKDGYCYHEFQGTVDEFLKKYQEYSITIDFAEFDEAKLRKDWQSLSNRLFHLNLKGDSKNNEDDETYSGEFSIPKDFFKE